MLILSGAVKRDNTAVGEWYYTYLSYFEREVYLD